MVQNLQNTGTVCITSSEPSVSQSTATAVVTPFVVTPTIKDQVNDLSQSVAESVLIDGVNNDNPPDYVDTDDEDMAVNHQPFSMEQVDAILASEDDNDNAMDSIDPTGTAAIWSK